MKLSRRPLLVWLYFVTCCMAFVAVGSLTAAQIMLLIDRYLGVSAFSIINVSLRDIRATAPCNCFFLLASPARLADAHGS